MELTAFAEFGIVIGAATIVAIIATKLKQPAILGYIIAGVIFRSIPHFHINEEGLSLFSELGITLLLFILGLELNLSELKNLGKVALVSGLGQIVCTFGLGYALTFILGFSLQASLYIALGLTFSSTIIVVKLLSLKKEADHLYGRISVGILLVQDFVAIGVLIVLSAFGRMSSNTGFSSIAVELVITVFKGLIAGIFIYLFMRFILNPLINWIRNEKEILFFTVISWALLLAALMGSKWVGFSAEIGGLVAGIALSNRFEHLQIESWMKPLRDFFLMLFFVMLGLHIDTSAVKDIIIPALILSAFVLLVKPALIIVLMKGLGYSRKVSFMAAIAIAQISEFSLIVANFGLQMKSIDASVLTLLTIVGGITMTISSYMIYYNQFFLNLFIRIFKNIKFKGLEEVDSKDHNASILMFGCHRMGKSLLYSAQDKRDEILVVDIDPRVVKELKDEGYNAIYGDITDTELYDKLRLKETRIIISTVPILKENLKLIHYVRDEMELRPMTIIYANDEHSVRELYDNGADFVIYPHMIGSQLLSNIVMKGSLNKGMVKLRNKAFEFLHLNS